MVVYSEDTEQAAERVSYVVLDEAIRALVSWMGRLPSRWGACEFVVWDGVRRVGRGRVLAPPWV